MFFGIKPVARYSGAVSSLTSPEVFVQPASLRFAGFFIYAAALASAFSCKKSSPHPKPTDWLSCAPVSTSSLQSLHPHGSIFSI
jgi:hypothetical protein